MHSATIFAAARGACGFLCSRPRQWFLSLPNAAVTIAAAAALLLYSAIRRSRYFGNTVPCFSPLLFFPLDHPRHSSEPTLWALPFLLGFHRRGFCRYSGNPLPAAFFFW